MSGEFVCLEALEQIIYFEFILGQNNLLIVSLTPLTITFYEPVSTITQTSQHKTHAFLSGKGVSE